MNDGKDRNGAEGGKKRQDITIWLAHTEQTGPIQTEPLSAQLKLRESDRDPLEKKKNV